MHSKSPSSTMVTTTMGYPAPPSPTLTNPDMILPWSEYDSIHSLPLNRTQKNDSNGAWTGSDINPKLDESGYIGMAIGPSSPVTPIIYGNGTMLSDIGEVTEVESTPAKRVKAPPAGQRKIQIQANNHNSPIQSSPTIGLYDTEIKKSRFGNHRRQVSVDSTSTIRTADEQNAEVCFDDFDDVSVDESGFGGDDEESVADDAYDHHVAVAQAALVARKDSVRKIMAEDSSSAALSRRAELILANAKKRLDNMEDNLTRARSSLYIPPSSSMSSIHSSSPLSRSTPSPPVNNERILSHPAARQRQTNQAYSSSLFPGHIRMSSENSHAPLQPRLPLIVRSDSASGIPDHHDARNTGQSRSSSDQESVESVRVYKSPLLWSSRSVTPLKSLSEDDAKPAQDTIHGARSATADPYGHPRIEYRGLTRSSSSMQMRDLTGKMEDLKGKIGQLRLRARDDQMRRRSLQSLRTPSPFTAADSWYASEGPYEGDDNADTGDVRSPWNGERSVAEEGSSRAADAATPIEDDQASEAPTVYEDFFELSESEERSEMVDEEPNNNMAGVDDAEFGETGEEAEEYMEEFLEGEYGDNRSESEASQYHDTITTPISHEDREDAFDYEHFFLHSAMGTTSRQYKSRRDSTSSFDSEGSVATARGPPAVRVASRAESRTARGHMRNQKSTDSVSTINTFATAAEAFTPEETIPEDEDNFFSNNPYDQDSQEERVATPTIVDPPTFDPTIGRAMTSNGTHQTDANVEQRTSPLMDCRPSSAPHNRSFSRPSVKSRPSISSFVSSSGTTRSFPLVNRPKDTVGPVPSSTGGNALPATTVYHERKMSELSNGFSRGSVNGNGEIRTSPVEGLEKGDQYLVERLVASLGKCVLGLQDDSAGSVEGRAWRRRLEVARKVLEGEVGM